MIKDHDFEKEVWRELSVEKVNEEAMEAFCLRNQIPFYCGSTNNSENVYFVRDGIDYIDSRIYALKSWGDVKDLEVVEAVNQLVWMHNYQEIHYEYELNGYNRAQEDEDLLHMFIG